MEKEFITCEECIYISACPCNWSLHNAACLAIQKPRYDILSINQVINKLSNYRKNMNFNPSNDPIPVDQQTLVWAEYWLRWSINREELEKNYVNRPNLSWPKMKENENV